MQERRNGYVYLIKAEPNLYKVGWATDVDRRLSALAPGFPGPLEVAHQIMCGDAREAEAFFHRQFAQYRHYGEWFDIPDRVVEGLAARCHKLRAGFTKPQPKYLSCLPPCCADGLYRLSHVLTRTERDRAQTVVPPSYFWLNMLISYCSLV